MLWWRIARAYAYVVWLTAKRAGVWLPGLGWICRRIQHEFPIEAEGRRYLFYPGAASMYGVLLIGRSMEPETHLFFRSVIPQVRQPIGFVDVGAAVGEMVIDAAGYPNVAQVIAFDPDPDNVEACRRSAALNGFAHVRVIEKAVADAVREVDFELQRKRGTSGRIVRSKTPTSEKLVCTTLDREIPQSEMPYLVLIDVEGAERLVMQGGARFIQRSRALIVFEYISGRDRNLREIAALLGGPYQIYRLRPDGGLDTDMSRTWNCVAVHRESIFRPACATLLGASGRA